MQTFVNEEVGVRVVSRDLLRNGLSHKARRTGLVCTRYRDLTVSGVNITSGAVDVRGERERWCVRSVLVWHTYCELDCTARLDSQTGPSCHDGQGWPLKQFAVGFRWCCQVLTPCVVVRVASDHRPTTAQKLRECEQTVAT